MSAPAELDTAPAGRVRLGRPGVRRAFGPIADARGMTRALLWIGTGLTLFFVLVRGAGDQLFEIFGRVLAHGRGGNRLQCRSRA